MTWRDSVASAINRLVRVRNPKVFSRDELIDREIETIIFETRTRGKTPEQTLSRVLQELRDDAQIEFTAAGEYLVKVHEVR
jgi:hypothetical protein